MTAVVMMGVSGCGKSSLGEQVAQALGWPLVEGDTFHPPENVAKMRAGVPLEDADREGWLATLGAELQAHGAGAVLTCSALKRSYRDQLRAARPGLRFVHLVLAQADARARVAGRDAHLFPPSLVASQFQTLEPPRGEDGVLEVDALLPLSELTRQVTAWLAATASKEAL